MRPTIGSARRGTLLIWLLALLPLAACRDPGEAAAAAGEPAEVVLHASDLAVVSDTTFVDAVILTGTLQPYRVTEVRAQLPGSVSALRADRGDAVQAGQTLAVLQADGIRSAADAARAGLAAAQAGEALARRQLDSARRLYERGALSAIELQGAQAAHDAAAGQLAGARASLASAAEAAGHAAVAAPFAGSVSSRTVNLGEAVSPGQALFTVVDASILELAGEVPVATAARLRPGARVRFTVDGYPGEQFTGQVARVEPVADAATRRVGVYLRTSNPAGHLLGGVFATGTVALGEGVRAAAVPAAAVRGSADSAFVWLVRGTSPQRQAVQLLGGGAAGELVPLRGLNPGDTVIVTPGTMRPGARLQIVRREANAEAIP